MIDQKLIPKLLKGLAIVLLLELVIYAIWIGVQPSIQMQTVDTIQSYEVERGYTGEKHESKAELDSTYYALSSLSLLNQTKDITGVKEMVMSQFDAGTSLFEASIEETYYAIGILNHIEALDSLNKSLLIERIKALETTNGFFRDSDEIDPIHLSNGELDHLFQAISTLDKLYTNKTQYYLDINRTQIASSFALLQNDDGGIGEGPIHHESSMKNAYLAASVMTKLNSSVEFFEQFGFSSIKLKQWIERMYDKEHGFKMNENSKPTGEATAYAAIALNRLGLTSDEIEARFGEGLAIMVSRMNWEVLEDETDQLDHIHDILLALDHVEMMDELNRPYISARSEITLRILVIISSILMVLGFLALLYLKLQEDESIYFDFQLQEGIEKLFDDYENGKKKLSDLLGDGIIDAVILDDENSTRATLKLQSENYEYAMQFEYEIFEVYNLSVIDRSVNVSILDLDFENSITIDYARNQLENTRK